MQQLASAALKSQRPPLVLAGWIQSVADEDGSSGSNSNSNSNTQRLQQSSGMLSSIGSSSHLTSVASLSKTQDHGSTPQLHQHLMSASPSSRPPPPVHEQLSVTADMQDDDDNDNLAQEFQILLQTRRTGTKLVPRDQSLLRDVSFYNAALERAVRCAVQAPNHKRTEPVTFKRMLAPSPRTHRLADIAYETHLRKKMASSASVAETTAIEKSVGKKREKWDQIPAFLVALVKSSHPLIDVTETMNDPYQPLAYTPPTSERELEDYATACASVQNCLLSLHAEHIATKWVTGPVVQTPAFRKLVQVTEYDRVVALIMVGEADDSKPIRPRRMRRRFHGDVLVDL